ncbi:MAG: glucose-6-phosphate dehydrogenase, partial [Sedimentisphaerales bacterium]|nr:glucose-6-phosphate dehydrogenase [Sedimentisphaerales bacterium]
MSQDSGTGSSLPNEARKQPAEFCLVIFGASGDLTRRKLIPAVFHLFRQGLLPERFSVVGYARSEGDDQAFRQAMREALESAGTAAVWDAAGWERFARRLHYQRGAYDRQEDFRQLQDRLEQLAPAGGSGNYLFYLATPPEAAVPIVRMLDQVKLNRRHVNQPSQAPWSRIILEKPFGTDLDSARKLNRHITAGFAEPQIFRIDHYLGKETVQNLLVLRFANQIFEPIWNNKYVDHVQIAVTETLGMEGRGAYYDRAGALRDIVQNHMMHLLALLALEPPNSLRADAIRDEKVKVLQGLRPLAPQCVGEHVVRAQYAAGTIDGQPVAGYRQEAGVAADSRTETFVALKLCVDNWRWAGVPFYLRTGKRMPVRITEIGIHFKPIPNVLFGQAAFGAIPPNRLSIRIQPNEGISLQFQVKLPGPEMRIKPYKMDFSYVDSFKQSPPEAYERLLLDALLGDSTLFARGDEVEAAWSFLQPILDACPRQAAGPLPEYPAGSWGPSLADEM